MLPWPGGYLSHGAIVAREYGIPAVVNIPGILTYVRQGDMLVVTGTPAVWSAIDAGYTL